MSPPDRPSQENSASEPAATAARARWIPLAVVAVLLLNLLDAVFTLGWLHRGVATEANPLLSELARDRPWQFVLVKVALVSLGLVILWRYRHLRMARLALAVALVVYVLLGGYHVTAVVLSAAGLAGK